jgi:hypothetical protein
LPDVAWTSLRTWVTGEFALSSSQEQAVAVLREQLLAPDPRVVVLEGPVGVGKSVVAGYFAQYNRDFFIGGATAVDGGEDIVAAAAAELKADAPSLVVVEDAHRAHELSAQLLAFRSALPQSRVILSNPPSSFRT